MVAAVVCLLVVAAIAGLVTERLVRGKREQVQRAAAWQAEWLCESAGQRAVAALTADGGYRGETWQVAAAELSGETRPAAGDGQAVITVAPLAAGADGPRGWRVAIEARYPADGPWSVRREREFTVAEPARGEGL